MSKALISVYDKNGIMEFAKELINLGWEIISSGGTAKLLAKAGVKVTTVEEMTNFPEMMDGRVKTLHPKIHAGILADRNESSHLQDAQEHNISMIDMVVVNLYPFAETISKADVTEKQAVHNIDIGGPTMLRAAAKNYKHVTVVTDPGDYQRVLTELKTGKVSLELKRELVVKVFSLTSRYDDLIANYFDKNEKLNLEYKKVRELRYGENPHQAATLYQDDIIRETSVVDAEVLHGKELSYNNIMDADGALNLIKEFDRAAAAVIKHTNPCGCAVADDIDTAFLNAYAGDSLSAFGGIIVLNRDCTIKIAEAINKVFAEVVLAPDYEPAVLDILKKKKNIRLLKLGEIKTSGNVKAYRQVVGGMLEQDFDKSKVASDNLKIVSKKKPSKTELENLLFAWQVAKHVKSNAIVLVKDKMIVGSGSGQMSRVDSVDIAIKKAGDRVQRSVCASDAFFPFRDGVDTLAKAGITAIIQPGGSIKDKDVITAVDEHKMSMVFTGVRSFKH